MRRGFGNRVTDEELLAKDFEKSQKEGLHVNIEIDSSQKTIDSTVPTGKPVEAGSGSGRFWDKRRMQPLNPHYNLSAYKPKVTPSRMRDGLSLNVSRDRLNHTHKMTNDQVFRIADKYALSQWFAPVWRIFRRFDLHRLKRYQRPVQLLCALLGTAMCCCIYFLYMVEMDCYHQLERRDQRDLQRLLRWIRMSDFKAICDQVMEEHDPLRVMSNKEQLQLVLAECRMRGLTDLEPTIAARRYGNLLREPDMYHFFYWTVMYLGACFSGGGMGYWDGFSEEMG
jgi:hypothetical protein